MSENEDESISDGTPPSILDKAFEVLWAFNEKERVLTLTEISRKCAMPKSTVHRLLHRLGEIGAIEQHNSGYRLGIKLTRLVSAMPPDSMREIALPHLSQLQSWSGLSVHFGVLREGEAVILQALFPHGNSGDRPFGIAGTRIPAHLSAMGRAMLAYRTSEEITGTPSGDLVALTPESITDPARLEQILQQVRVNGYAVQRDEVTPGLGYIAAPVLIRSRPMGAVAVQFPSRTSIKEPLINAVKVTARRIERDTYSLLSDRPNLFPFDL